LTVVERRKFLLDDLNVKVASKTVTIPIGGGTVLVDITAAEFGFTRVDVVLDLRVARLPPVVPDVYLPSYGVNATNDAIGITISAGTGTTLRIGVAALGA